MNNVGDSFRDALNTIINFLPNLLAFVVILVIGYIVAKLIAKVVQKVLESIGVDRRLRESDGSRYVDAVLPGASPARGVARLVFWLVFVFFLVAAISALEIPAATNFMNSVLAFLPNVIVAILIFVVAALLAGAVAAAVTRTMGDSAMGRIVASVVPALILVIAMFMILEQLQIAPEIIRIAFAAVMFAIALALALAFGLGGRDVAARLLEDADRAGRQHAHERSARRAQGGVGNGSGYSGDGSTYDSGYQTGGAHAGTTASDPYATQQMATPTSETEFGGTTGTNRGTTR